MTDQDGKPCFDGVFYLSHNNFPAACLAIFDRAGPKLALATDLDLVDHAAWPGFVSDFRIGIVAGLGQRAAAKRI